MVLVSVTRLRLRSLRYLLPFLWYAVPAARQAKQASGNLGSQTRVTGGLVFWTLTLWQDETAMKMYRDSGVHLQAMPKLRRWCDQSASAHWQQEPAEFPSWPVAEERLRELSRNVWQRGR